MPYIDEHTKRRIDEGIVAPHTAGELTYVLVREILRYVDANELRYQTLAEVMGALEGAKADINRRLLEPYERQAQLRNGDVYSDDLLVKVHPPHA